MKKRIKCCFFLLWLGVIFPESSVSCKQINYIQNFDKVPILKERDLFAINGLFITIFPKLKSFYKFLYSCNYI